MIFVFQIASQILFLHCAYEAYGWMGLAAWALFAPSWVVMFGWAFELLLRTEPKP